MARYKVVFTVFVDADDEAEAMTNARDAVEGFEDEEANAKLSHSIEKREVDDGETGT